MSQKILRKLSKMEILYDNEVKHKNMIISMIFMIDCKTELSIHIAKEASTYLVKRHPLLRAVIKRTENELERYFVEMEEVQASNFDNVDIVSETDSSKWTDFLNKMIDTNEFDYFNEYLWRMRFVKLNPDQARTYNYVLLYVHNHAIGDGRNSYEIGVHYLNILAALSQDRRCKEMDEGVVEHSLYTHDELVALKGLDFKRELIEQDDMNRDVDAFKGHGIDRNNKFEYFHLTRDKLEQLIAKMRTNTRKAKLTSVLTMLLCVVFKKIYLNHRITSVPTTQFNYNLITCLRDRLDLGRSVMGVYSSSLHMHETISESEFLEIETGNFDNFWKKCDDHALRVHHCLSENQDLTSFADSDKTIEYFNQSPATPQKPNNINFVMSSVGVMPNTSTEEIIKIEEFYFRTTRKGFESKRLGYALFFGVATVGRGNLCMPLTFTEDYMSTEIVRELICEFKGLIEKIIL
jgi:hypothetical protein